LFRNRAFQVKMVKDPEPNKEEVPKSEPVDYSGVVDALGRNVVGIMIVYFGGDTLRQVIIHVAKEKI